MKLNYQKKYASLNFSLTILNSGKIATIVRGLGKNFCFTILL